MQQRAKSWELRASMSLARLWRDQGKVLEARELLAPVRAGSLKASTRSTTSRLRRYSVSSAPDNEFRNGLLGI